VTKADVFKCGYVALAGAPNVGKSTLLNRLLAEKLAIVSPKPQTTRHRLLGVINRPGAQVLFLDTPGLIEAKDMLNEALVKAALGALTEADVVVWLVSPLERERDHRMAMDHMTHLAKPVIVAINKIDMIPKPELLPLMARYHEIYPAAPVVPISALQGDGLSELLGEIIAALPEGPPLYDEEHLTDKTERFLVAEIIREKVFRHTSQEIPYAIAVSIEEFDERQRPDLVRIRAVLYVERESQKGIIIGQQGRLLKIIGQEARRDIELLLGARVFLELWVKVWKNWRKDPRALRQLGLLET